MAPQKEHREWAKQWLEEYPIGTKGIYCFTWFTGLDQNPAEVVGHDMKGWPNLILKLKGVKHLFKVAYKDRWEFMKQEGD